MAIVKVFQIRCQFRGVLPGIYHSPQAAESERAKEELECQRLYREHKVVGDLDPDGNARWARSVPVRFDVPDSAAAAFEPWEEPAYVPDSHDRHALSLLPNDSPPSVLASVAAALRGAAGGMAGPPGTVASGAGKVGFAMTGTVTPPAVEG